MSECGWTSYLGEEEEEKKRKFFSLNFTIGVVRGSLGLIFVIITFLPIRQLCFLRMYKTM